MPRPLRCQQSEFAYHVTTRTNNGEFRLRRKKDQRAATKICGAVLFIAAKKYNVILHHVVVMSNHPHLVLRTPDSNISLFMQFVNARTAERLNKLQNRTGHLWGGRFKSVIVESEAQLRRLVQYVYNNPVRAQLTENAIDYEDSTISFYAFGRPAFLEVQPDGLFLSMGLTDEERRQVFITEFIGVPMAESAIEEVRAGMRTGYYGAVGFAERLKQVQASSPPLK
jgi:putative transposase